MSPDTLDQLEEEAGEAVEGFNEKLDFEEYLDVAQEDPGVARSATQRIYDMFESYGSEFDEENDIKEYAIVTEDPENDGEEVLYGDNIQEAVYEVVKKVENASRNLADHKRLALMLGPVGSGKTAFSNKMEDYFEEYTQSDEGKMYTWDWENLYSLDTEEIGLDLDEEAVQELKGVEWDQAEETAKLYPIGDQDPRDDTVTAPQNQDPLLLLPEEQRDVLVEDLNEDLDAPYTLRLDRDLTPESQLYVDNLTEFYLQDADKEDEDAMVLPEELRAEDENEARRMVYDNHVTVRRLVADEGRKQAIASHEPKEEKAQDQADLTGAVDMSKIGTYGENDPRAFDYAGALNVANRGIFSGEEFLKNKEDLLYTFLEATENGTIDPKNQPKIDIDTFVVGRTNMAEFLEKKDNDKMKAFNSRTNKIDFAYNLEFDDEAKIYEQFLENSDYDVHVEPHTLEMASLFAVASRLEDTDDPQFDTLVEKAKIYNGDIEADDVEKLMRESDEAAEHGEGMDGVTPRYIEDQIAETVVTNTHEGRDNISSMKLLGNLAENLDSNGSIPRERHDEFRTMIERVEEEYKERAQDDLRQALAYDKDELQQQGEKYFDHVMGYVDNDTVENEFGENVQPDEKFLRRVEEHIDVREDTKDEFRTSVAKWIARRSREGDSFDPLDNDRLREGLKEKAWEEKKNNINFTALIANDDESLGDEQRSSTIDALTDMGYSEEGAEEVLQVTGAEVAKEEIED